MEIIDITLPVAPRMLAYAGDAPVEIVPLAFAEPGQTSTYNLSLLHLPTHTGTHVDAPLHFDNHGPDVASLPLDVLCGPARVLSLAGRGLALDRRVLGELDLRGVERLLIKSDNSARLGQVFFRDYAHLTGDGAAYLRAETQVRLVGIDYLSVDAWPGDCLDFDFPAHHALLDGPDPVLIIEGLDLRAVDPGDYLLWCLPLKLVAGDGAPARAVLLKP
jgi:arylformamidase